MTDPSLDYRYYLPYLDAVLCGLLERESCDPNKRPVILSVKIGDEPVSTCSLQVPIPITEVSAWREALLEAAAGAIDLALVSAGVPQADIQALGSSVVQPADHETEDNVFAYLPPAKNITGSNARDSKGQRPYRPIPRSR